MDTLQHANLSKPRDLEALSLTDLAKRVRCRPYAATDPDADRVGIAQGSARMIL